MFSQFIQSNLKTSKLNDKKIPINYKQCNVINNWKPNFVNCQWKQKQKHTLKRI